MFTKEELESKLRYAKTRLQGARIIWDRDEIEKWKKHVSELEEELERCTPKKS